MRDEREAAFTRIMGLVGMPPDCTPEYDEWLFNQSYSAGAEQMREDFAAKIEQNWGKEQADLCRKFPLPVGESSRAPEGSKP